tara:strand:+ start:107 stop:430 length:324 start_codon:yes stop_codon:yes gene_type:complete
MVTITEEAANHLYMVGKGNYDTVEFSVSAGGCSGMNYELHFTDRDTNDRDKIIHFPNGKMKLIIPFASYVYVEDTVIDYSNDLLNGGFKFTNPMAERSCGCGTSFSV